MTLPASGTITMTNVKNELSTSFPLTLNDSRVHTLFGVSGNPIKLTDGYGKSSQTRWLPTGYTTTATLITSPTNMYDNQNPSLAFTAANQTTVGSAENYDDAPVNVILSFGSIATAKTLKMVAAVAVSASAVQDGDYYMDCGEGMYKIMEYVSGNANITVSLATDGTTFVDQLSYNAFYTTHGYYANGSFTKQLLTIATGVSGSNVKVKFKLSGSTQYDVYADPGCANYYLGSTSGIAVLSLYGLCLE